MIIGAPYQFWYGTNWRYLMSTRTLTTLIGLAFIMTACGGGDGSEPKPGPFGNDDVDFQLWSCGKRYVWNGLFFTWQCPDGGWRVVSNQPVFTSADDCHVAVHLIQQRDPDTWDNHDEAKKVILRASGFAYFLACFEV